MIRVSNGLDPDRTKVLSFLILVQSVCKGYQQLTKVDANKERDKAYVDVSSIARGLNFGMRLYLC